MEDSKYLHKFKGEPTEYFHLWLARTEAALEAKEVYYVVESNPLKDGSMEIDGATTLAIAKARVTIIQGLGETSLQLCISDKHNPFITMNSHKDLYAVSNVVTRVQLNSKLVSLSYKSHRMPQYINQSEQAFTRLAGMHSAVSGDMQVAMLLSSFGDKNKSPYGNVVSSLQTIGESLTWEVVTARLLQEYDELLISNPSVSRQGQALTMTSHRGQELTIKGRTFEPNWRRIGQKRRPCYNGHEEGHFIRHCPRRKHKYNKVYNSSRHSSNADEQANPATLLVAVDGNMRDKTLHFLLDSGAGSHMIHWKNALQHVKEIPVHSIVLGNGSVVTSNMKGTASLIADIGDGEEKEVMLKNVLCVPKLHINLISCSSLVEDGYELEIGRKGCSAVKHGNLMLRCVLYNGVYRPRGEVKIEHVANIASSFDEKLWHTRLGHANIDSICRLARDESVIGLNGPASASKEHCGSCLKGKHTQESLKSNSIRARRVGEVIHSYICGPTSFLSLGKSRCCVSFIDEFSGYLTAVPIARKSDVQKEFEIYIAWLERKYDCTVKRLHSDSGGEYVAMEGFLRSHGIEFSRSPSYSKEQNGIAERANRTIMETTRSMLSYAKMPGNIWAEAVVHACDIRNRFYAPRRGSTTSYELLTGQKPCVDHIRVFGCREWVHIPKEKRRKLDDKSEEGLLIGCYDNKQNKVWLRTSKEATVSRHVAVDEKDFPAESWFEDAPHVDTTVLRTSQVTNKDVVSLPVKHSGDTEKEAVSSDSDGDIDEVNIQNNELLTYVPPPMHDGSAEVKTEPQNTDEPDKKTEQPPKPTLQVSTTRS